MNAEAKARLSRLSKPEAEKFLAGLTLSVGSHASIENGACILEAVAFVAGEKFSDSPSCASPLLGEFLRAWNDSMADAARQKLKPFVVRLVDTKGTKADEAKRGLMIADWYLREFTPTWLELAGLSEHAALLRSCREVLDWDACEEMQPKLAKASEAAGAAWGAAWGAAESAAESALEPTVVRLQTSAFALLDRLIAVTEKPAPKKKPKGAAR